MRKRRIKKDQKRFARTAKKVKKVMDELPESYHLHLGNK